MGELRCLTSTQMSSKGYKVNRLSILGTAQREAVLQPTCAKRDAHARLLGGNESNALTTAFRTIATSIVVPALATIDTTAHLLDSTSVD